MRLTYAASQAILDLNEHGKCFLYSITAKAYMVLVREQSFEKGRGAMPLPPVNVHREIENGSTDLGKTGKVYRDGRLWLDW